MSAALAPDPKECPRCSQVHKVCRAHNRAGKPCRRPPETGAAVCYLHGGGAPQVRARAKERRVTAAAARAVERFGLEQEVAPGEALLAEVTRTAAMTAYLGELVALLPDEDLATDPAYGVWMVERDRLARVSKAALDAGVAERAVQVQEAQAQVLFTALARVLDRLGITGEQRVQAVQLIRAELSAG